MEHSIIISVFNEPKEILKQANDVFAKEKVYLVINYNDKKTIEYAKEVCPNFNIIISNKESHLKSVNINYCLDFVKESIVGIFDIDNIPSKTYINNCVKYLNNNNVGIVVGREEIINKNTFAEELAYMEQQQYLDTIEYAVVPTSGGYLTISGAGYFMKTSELKRIRMNEDTVTEDADLSIRLLKNGIKGKMIKEKLFIQTPYNLKGYINQRVRWTKGHIQLLFRDHKDLKSINKVLHTVYGFLVFSPIFGIVKLIKYLAILFSFTFSVPLGFILLACALFTDLEDKYWMVVKTQGLIPRRLSYITIFSEVLYIYVLIKSLYEYRRRRLYWYLTEKEGMVCQKK